LGWGSKFGLAPITLDIAVPGTVEVANCCIGHRRPTYHPWIVTAYYPLSMQRDGLRVDHWVTADGNTPCRAMHKTRREEDCFLRLTAAAGCQAWLLLGDCGYSYSGIATEIERVYVF